MIIFALSATLVVGLLIRVILEFRKMSAATDRLTASVVTLATTVDAAMVKLTAPVPTDDTAAVTAAADAVDALNGKLVAALTPPAV